MTQGRKKEHLRICAEMDVEFQHKTTLLEHVHPVHAALAEISIDEIDTGTSFMGRKLRAPLLISAMSGGVTHARDLNRDLARAAQKLGIGFCLGSQRPMLENPKLIGTYQVRRFAPDVPILGNIGVQQAAAAKPRDIERLVTCIEADGLAVHLNPAQELSQLEGDRRFPDGYRTLKILAKRLPGRIMVKETGCGISREVARKLKRAGIRVVDTAGAGGTSWTRVEHLRNGVKPAARGWLDEWGIPTAASLMDVAPLGLKVAASGGLRSGYDAAKCLMLGADVCGMALPVLRAYMRGGYPAVLAFFEQVRRELKTVMLLVGAKDIPSLKKHKPVITGELAEWATRTR
ncbi:MAG: type 2 isopentenyl-diphosphate Delta-isomerase [Elusimicrobiota bacterium]